MISPQTPFSFFLSTELWGKLHAFDAHLNIVLGDVEERVTVVEIADTYESISKTVSRKMDLLFVRGDGIILIAPPIRQ